MNSTIILAGAYDKYSPVLYGIALKIASIEKQAEEILISTFIKASKENIFGQAHPNIYIRLVKLLVQTAYEQLELTNVPDLKAFEKMPLLQKLLQRQMDAERLRIGHKVPETA